MPQQLPQSLGAVNIGQASTIIRPETDNRKQGKGGKGKNETARDSVCVLHSQASKSLPVLGRASREHQGQGHNLCPLLLPTHH